MTIEPSAPAANPPAHDGTPAAWPPCPEAGDPARPAGSGRETAELTRFVFHAPSTSGVLQRARELLAAAPRELSESFEQAVRGAGLQA